MGIFGSRSWWEDDLSKNAGSIGQALGQVITGQMPADFLNDVMGVSLDPIKSAYAAAAEEGKSKKAEKIIWRSIEFPAEHWCELRGVPKSVAWNETRALKDMILTSCQTD